MAEGFAVCARHPFDCSVEKHASEWRDDALRLRARLSEVEAERDRYRADYTMTALENEQLNSGFWGAIELRDAAEANLAEVEALCDTSDNWEGANRSILHTSMVRAAARGEGERPAEQMLADVQREHARAWRDEVRPNLGPVSGEGDR